MAGCRTDLAVESLELSAKGSRGERVAGVESVCREEKGYEVTYVRVCTEEGSQAMGKPLGSYITVDLRPYFRRESTAYSRAIDCVAGALRTLLPEDFFLGRVLVAGLGNREMTSDAIGPMSTTHLLVTRHLSEVLGELTCVMALCPGVVGATGIETLEILRGAVERTGATAVIAVDALAAQASERLCATVQLSDTGLIPGSGVGNHRQAVNRETLGVPVFCVGVPTVIDAAALCGEGACAVQPGALFVTPRDIDSRMREMARIVGQGLNLALQPKLTAEELAGLTG
jgi:spore protease